MLPKVSMYCHIIAASRAYIYSYISSLFRYMQKFQAFYEIELPGYSKLKPKRSFLSKTMRSNRKVDETGGFIGR